MSGGGGGGAPVYMQKSLRPGLFTRASLTHLPVKCFLLPPARATPHKPKCAPTCWKTSQKKRRCPSTCKPTNLSAVKKRHKTDEMAERNGLTGQEAATACISHLINSWSMLGEGNIVKEPQRADVSTACF